MMYIQHAKEIIISNLVMITITIKNQDLLSGKEGGDVLCYFILFLLLCSFSFSFSFSFSSFIFFFHFSLQKAEKWGQLTTRTSTLETK